MLTYWLQRWRIKEQLLKGLLSWNQTRYYFHLLSKSILNISSHGPNDNNIGAYLVLLQEILILSKIYKKKQINFSFINKINKNFFKENFINFFKLKINLVEQHKSKFINLSNIKKKNELYSLSLINLLYKKYKIKII